MLFALITLLFCISFLILIGIFYPLLKIAVTAARYDIPTATAWKLVKKEGLWS